MKHIENPNRKIEPAPDTRRELDGLDEDDVLENEIIKAAFRILCGIGILTAAIVLFAVCALFGALCK